MERFDMYLTEEQKQALREIAHQRTMEERSRVTMADIIREAIDLFLRQILRNT